MNIQHPNSKFKMIPEFHKPEIIEKTWGKEIVIHNSNLYCGKLLKFKKDHHSSNHYHTQKTETWFILEGQLILEYKNNSKILNPGDIVHLHPLTQHKLTSLTNSTILEVSTQHHDHDTTRISPSGKL